MKILKKTKIKPITCKTCGCIYLPSSRDLKAGTVMVYYANVTCKCPVCKMNNIVEFEKEKSDEQRKADCI